MPQPPGQPPQQPQLRQDPGIGADILGELRHNAGSVLQQALDPRQQAMLGASGNAVMTGLNALTKLFQSFTVPIEQRGPIGQTETPEHQRQRGEQQGSVLSSILTGAVPVGGEAAAAENAVETMPEIVVNAKPNMDQFHDDFRKGMDAVWEHEHNSPMMEEYRARDDWAGKLFNERSRGLVGEQGQLKRQVLWDEVQQHPEYKARTDRADALKPSNKELMERYQPLSEAVQKHLPPGWTVRREIDEFHPGFKDVHMRVFDDKGHMVLGDVRGIDQDIWHSIINQGKRPPTGAEVVRDMMRAEGKAPANDTPWDELQGFMDQHWSEEHGFKGEVKPFKPTEPNLLQAARENISPRPGFDPSNVDPRANEPANDPKDVQPYYKAADAMVRGDLREAFEHLPQGDRIKHLDHLFDAVNAVIDKHGLAGDSSLMRDLGHTIEDAADAIERGRPEGEFTLRRMETLYNRYAKSNPALMEEIGQYWFAAMSDPEMPIRPKP